MAEPIYVDQATEARWEIVDAHRCTECGYLSLNGYAMTDHLWTHARFACELFTPPSDDGRCRGCGWDRMPPGWRQNGVNDLGALHADHRGHSAAAQRLRDMRASDSGPHRQEETS